jgi:hypothetical protein
MATKERDLVSLTFLVESRDMPERVKLKEHSVAFAKSEELVGGGSLISGVYGAHSKQMALVLAAAWTRDNRQRSTGPNQILQLDVGYRVNNFIETRSTTTHETLESTGWLHMDRLSAELREDLKDEWLGWIRADLGNARANRHVDTPFAEIAMEFPLYVGKMLAKRSPRLLAVVHPVRPTIDPTAVLWVATVRYDKERFVDPVIRFLPNIKVEV